MLVFAEATLADGSIQDVRVDPESGVIDTIGSNLTGDTVIDATDHRLLPGMIDVHVHFRQPGFSHKETWRTGSQSAVAGGVTTVFDQPNTAPPTVTSEAVRQKEQFAEASLVDYGLNGGVTEDWDPDSLLSAPISALGEVFLADSTGDMGIEIDLFRTAVEQATKKGLPVTVHAEDAGLFDDDAKARAGPERGRKAAGDVWSAYRRAEAEVAAIEQACAVAEETDAQVHVAHTSTPDGIDIAAEAGLTCEVTPHHMFLSRDDLDDLGTFGRMNPPLRSEARRSAVAKRVRAGPVDVIATDHAPHTLAEKDASILEAPSGVPGVETALPLLLEEVRQGRLTFDRVRDLTAANPARLFDLPQKGRIESGRDADLVLVDPDDAREIREDDLHSKCDWTPFAGMTGVFPVLTMVRGRVVYERTDDGEEFAAPSGTNVRA